MPTRRDGGTRRLALKVTFLDSRATIERFGYECSALGAWAGDGAVRLVDADPATGAQLLEWLAGPSLESRPVDEAVTVGAGLLRRLAVPAPVGLPTVAERAPHWPGYWRRAAAGLGSPVPGRLLEAAADVCVQLGPSAGDLLIHDDLHYGNVLLGDRGWTAVDPKVLVAGPELGAGPMLWRRYSSVPAALRRLDRIVEVAGLDAARTRAWTLARTVEYWLWALGVGLTRDPKMCAALADALAA